MKIWILCLNQACSTKLSLIETMTIAWKWTRLRLTKLSLSKSNISTCSFASRKNLISRLHLTAILFTTKIATAMRFTKFPGLSISLKVNCFSLSSSEPSKKAMVKDIKKVSERVWSWVRVRESGSLIQSLLKSTRVSFRTGLLVSEWFRVFSRATVMLALCSRSRMNQRFLHFGPTMTAAITICSSTWCLMPRLNSISSGTSVPLFQASSVSIRTTRRKVSFHVSLSSKKMVQTLAYSSRAGSTLSSTLLNGSAIRSRGSTLFHGGELKSKTNLLSLF